MRRGGHPQDTRFATKPQLAGRMIARALDAGTPAAWVTGDEVYGADPGLRAGLERRAVGYVLAVAVSHPVTTAATTLQARTLAARPQMIRSRSPATRSPRCPASWSSPPSQAPGTGCDGQPGGGATSAPPGPATTGGKPPATHEHNESDDPQLPH